MRQIQASLLRVTVCAVLLLAALGPPTTGLAQAPPAELIWAFEGLRQFERRVDGCPPSVGLHGFAVVGETSAAGWSVSGCGLRDTGLVAASREGDGEWSQLTHVPVAMHGRPALTLSPQGHPFYVYADAGPNDTYHIYEQDMTGGLPIQRMGIAASQSSLSHPNISATFASGAIAPTFAWAARTGFGGPLMVGSPAGDVSIATVATYSVDNDGPHVAAYANHTAGPGVYYSPGISGDLRPVLATTQSGGVSIARAPDGRIYLASSGGRSLNGVDDTRLVALSSSDGQTWDRTEIDVSNTRNPSLAVDSFGNPAIAYVRNGTELRLARRVNGAWQHARVAALPLGDGSATPHLAFDAAGRPNLLFYDTATQTIALARGVAAALPGTLAVSKVGTGSGDVVSVPAGIACGAVCQASYSLGQYVLLEANAHGNSAFEGWGGACSGTGPCLVTMNASASVVATFGTPRPPIEVSAPGTGGCSLANAIAAANADAPVGACAAGSGADVIRLPAGIYQLTAVDNTTPGLPIISSDIRIVGEGPQSTIIERAAGAPAFRLLRVLFTAGTRLTLEGVTLRGGDGEVNGGGAIYANNPVVIRNSVLVGNHAGSSVGGAIRSNAALTIAGSQFTDNQAPSGEGGAIYSVGTVAAPLTISTSKFENNLAMWGGAIDYSTSAPHASAGLIVNTIFNANTALRGGGALRGSALTLARVTVTGNRVTAPGSGGGGLFVREVTILDSTIADNSVSGPVGGGGVLNSGGTLTIQNSTIARNIAEYGGGVSMSGVVTLTNVTFSGNRSVTRGAGLLQGGGRADLHNVTVVDNQAGTVGGGIVSAGYAMISLRNSIVALNRGGSDYPDCYSSGYPLTSTGHNLIGNRASCPYTPNSGDQVGTALLPIDPRLSPLQDNGGATFTHLPGLDSPAVDAGNPLPAGGDISACEGADQRGVQRPQRAACDIGAVERANAVPISVAQAITIAEDTTAAIVISAADADGDVFSYTIVESPSHGVLSGVAPHLTYTPFADFNGTDQFAFAATDAFDTAGEPAIITIAITPVNDPPSVRDDVVSVKGNGGAQVVDVLANDSNAPDSGETLSLLSFTSPAHGTVTKVGATHFLYTPPLRFVGLDSFTYTVTDHHGPTARANVTVQVTPTVDLGVAVAATPNPSTTGAITSWRMTVSNEGANDAIGGTATMSFVGQVGFLALPSGCSRSVNLVSCDLPMLLSGQSHEFEVSAAPEATGAVTLTGHAEFPGDPATANNSAFVIVPVLPTVDLNVDITGVATAAAGTGVSYNVRVNNVSGVTATGVVLTVMLPSNADFIGASAQCSRIGLTLTCPLGALAVNSPVDLEVIVSPPRPGTLLILANATSTERDLTDNSASHETIVGEGNADLGLTIAAPPPLVTASGATVSYELLLTNHGPVEATGIVVSVALPAGTELVSAGAPPGSGMACLPVAATHSVTCTKPTLTDALTVPIAITIRHTTAIDPIALVASVTGTKHDPFAPNNGVTVMTALAADLRVELTAAPVPPTIGLPFAYTIVVTNDGPGVARNVRMDVSVPWMTKTTLTMLPLVCEAVDEDGVSHRCSAPAMVPGQGATFSVGTGLLPLTEMVSEEAPADVRVESDTVDTHLANNAAHFSTRAATSTDLRVDFRPTAGNIYRGDLINYHVDVINEGLMSLGSATTTVTLPVDSVFVGATASDATACAPLSNVAPPTVQCDHSWLGFQGTAAIAIRTQLADSSVPMTASASVTSVVTELDPDDNAASVTVTPQPRAGRALLIIDGGAESDLLNAFSAASAAVNIRDLFHIPSGLQDWMDELDGLTDRVNDLINGAFIDARARVPAAMRTALQLQGCNDDIFSNLYDNDRDVFAAVREMNVAISVGQAGSASHQSNCLRQMAAPTSIGGGDYQETWTIRLDETRHTAIANIKTHLLDLQLRGLVVDLLITAPGCGAISHFGNPTCGTSGLSLPDGVISADDIRNLNDGDPLRLGWVYNTASFGSLLNDAWLELGAQSANGAFERNFSALLSPLSFLDGVTRLGLPPDIAADRANAIDAVLIAHVIPQPVEIGITVPWPTEEDLFATKDLTYEIAFAAFSFSCDAWSLGMTTASMPIGASQLLCSAYERTLQEMHLAESEFFTESRRRVGTHARVTPVGPALLSFPEIAVIPSSIGPIPIPYPNVSIGFADIVQSGTTSFSIVSPAAIPDIPSGWQLSDPPLAFEIHTDAIYSGPITLTISYDPALVNATALTLLHYTNGAFEQVVFVVDAYHKTMTAIIQNLSPFVLVTPTNTAPVASAGSDQTVIAASAAGAPVVLDGTASSDPDGDPLTYAWAWTGGSASLATPTATFPIGVHTVTLTVSDGHGHSATDSMVVTVTPPVVPVVVAGRMHGQGYVIVDNHRVKFDFSVLENPKKGERATVDLRISGGRNGKWDDDRFDARSVSDVSFANAPSYAPGKNPKTGADTVRFAGTGKWDKRDHHTYVVTASDRGEPGRGVDTFTIEVRAPNGQIVFSGGGTIADGNVQSTRVKR